MLEQCLALLVSSTREIVAASLSFIKVYCKALPSPTVATSLPLIIKSMCNMADDCSRHLRLKVRDILNKLVRKYGSECISPHIPVSNTVMYKRLRNLRKLNARKKRQKDNNNDENSSDDEEFHIKAKPKTLDEILADSDSDFDDVDAKATETSKPLKKRKQPNTWIEEDSESIIDFTDPNVVSKITATKPNEGASQLLNKKPVKKDRGFKTAEDGRLIIKDDSSSDSETEKRKKKLKFDSDGSNSEDDDRSVAETLLLGDRKRKRTESVKSGVSGSSRPLPKYKAGGVGIHRFVFYFIIVIYI